MAKSAAKFAVKNKALDSLCNKVKGYNEMYPNTNSRRAKMFDLVSDRLHGTESFGIVHRADDFKKLLKMIGSTEFEDAASFDEYLQAIK